MAELVGRTRELARLSAFVGACRDGPAALTIEGEPGIGKTALLEQAIAAAAGLRVLKTRCGHAETGLACAGLADLLSSWQPEHTALSPPLRRALEIVLLRADSADLVVEPHAVGRGVGSNSGVRVSAAGRDPGQHAVRPGGPDTDRTTSAVLCPLRTDWPLGQDKVLRTDRRGRGRTTRSSRRTPPRASVVSRGAQGFPGRGRPVRRRSARVSRGSGRSPRCVRRRRRPAMRRRVAGCSG